VTATPKNWLPTQGLLARLNNFLAGLDNPVAGFCGILNTAHRNTHQIVSINAYRALAPPQPSMIAASARNRRNAKSRD
jgi:hypothetical protein